MPITTIGFQIDLVSFPKQECDSDLPPILKHAGDLPPSPRSLWQTQPFRPSLEGNPRSTWLTSRLAGTEQGPREKQSRPAGEARRSTQASRGPRHRFGASPRLSPRGQFGTLELSLGTPGELRPGGPGAGAALGCTAGRAHALQAEASHPRPPQSARGALRAAVPPIPSPKRLNP